LLVKIHLKRPKHVLVVLDEFYLAVIFDQMNLFVVIYCFVNNVIKYTDKSVSQTL